MMESKIPGWCPAILPGEPALILAGYEHQPRDPLETKADKKQKPPALKVVLPE
jgi:hypothetical protein